MASNGVNGASDTAEKVIADLNGTHTLPLWAQMAKLNPPLPNPKCIPHLWRYDKIKPLLLRAGNTVTEKQAERRVLMLINPARGTYSSNPWYETATYNHL
jgi:gentisate 1,2-dioxygenase